MPNEDKKPVGDVFAIVSRGERVKPLWIELGPVWVNKDGSLSFELVSQPIAWSRSETERRLQIRFRDRDARRAEDDDAASDDIPY